MCKAIALNEHEKESGVLSSLTEDTEAMYREAILEYEAKEADVEEIKFQDRTRGRHVVKIYTRDGMVKNFPIVGEIDTGGIIQAVVWTVDGKYRDDFRESPYDLIPVKPLPLEGKKVGDFIYSLDKDGDVVDWKVYKEYTARLWVESGVRKLCIHYDGSVASIGNGKQLFFPTEEEARKSVENDK